MKIPSAKINIPPVTTHFLYKTSFPIQMVFKAEDLTGMVQFFHHSPLSHLPVRDVSGKLTTIKTEPHIEIGAENFLTPCYQRNLKRFAQSPSVYLFLITSCKNPDLDANGIQYVVGFIKKEEVINRENHVAVQGPTFLYDFRDSIPVRTVFSWQSFNRPILLSQPYVNEEQTQSLLEQFHNRDNIVGECIKEIIRLDTDNLTCIGDSCDYKAQCVRYKYL